ncbi:Uncharacterised protein [uncultured archaeon]|nr:Uncharacterised protein [uncultured archaeon]
MDFKICNGGSYRWIKVILNSSDDASLIARIKEKALEVSKKVNPKNLGREVRTPEEIYNHCLPGIFAEEVVKGYLRRLGEENDIDLEVIEEEFSSYKTHVDVKIKLNGNIKTIEVRSSFQYLTALINALNGKFGLIGTYIHASKKHEEIKDFHITVLHRCNPIEFEDIIDKFNPETLIIGGVSRDDLKIYGELDKGKMKQEGVEYLQVRPIISAPKDTIDLFKKILEIE